MQHKGEAAKHCCLSLLSGSYAERVWYQTLWSKTGESFECFDDPSRVNNKALEKSSGSPIVTRIKTLREG